MPGHNADRSSSTIQDNVANSGHNTLISGVDPVVGRQRSITARSIGGRMAIDVNILDSSGDQISTFGSGQQYAEGDVDSTISGTAMLWEDTGDTLRAVSAAKPLPVNVVAGGSLKGLDIPEHDYLSLTYVASGNGAGEIETVTYKTGGAGGTTVATVTIAYNASHKISSVTVS